MSTAFDLTEDQVQFQDMAQDFADVSMAPYAAVWDADEIFPVETLRNAASLGLAGIYCREEFGGTGLTRHDATVIFEALSTGCVSTAAYMSIHNMAAWMIDTFGTDQQRGQYLPKLFSMEHFASYCLTEPGAGSDAGSLKTRVTC